MKKIEFYSKAVYGTDLLYIKDEKVAKTIQSLTGKKTISEANIFALESLGLEFEQVV